MAISRKPKFLFFFFLVEKKKNNLEAVSVIQNKVLTLKTYLNAVHVQGVMCEIAGFVYRINFHWLKSIIQKQNICTL